jgi:hypothetical protein
MAAIEPRRTTAAARAIPTATSFSVRGRNAQVRPAIPPAIPAVPSLRLLSTSLETANPKTSQRAGTKRTLSSRDVVSP